MRTEKIREELEKARQKAVQWQAKAKDLDLEPVPFTPAGQATVVDEVMGGRTGRFSILSLMHGQLYIWMLQRHNGN